MTDKECCCTCYFGEMLNIDELICQHEDHNLHLMSHPYYWTCLKWKELDQVPLPDHVKAGFNRGSVDIAATLGFGVDL